MRCNGISSDCVWFEVGEIIKFKLLSIKLHALFQIKAGSKILTISFTLQWGKGVGLS